MQEFHSSSHRDIKRTFEEDEGKKAKKWSRTRNSRQFRISKFGTYKYGSCPLQEFHPPRYQANFASQYFLRQVPQRPWGQNKNALEQEFQENFGFHSSESKKWKLSIARISFTEISSEFCHPVFLETGSSEAVEAKQNALEQEIQDNFGFQSSEPTKIEVVHCKNLIHRDIK